MVELLQFNSRTQYIHYTYTGMLIMRLREITGDYGRNISRNVVSLTSVVYDIRN